MFKTVFAAFVAVLFFALPIAMATSRQTSDDKLGNFEIQDLMSRSNSAQMTPNMRLLLTTGHKSGYKLKNGRSVSTILVNRGGGGRQPYTCTSAGGCNCSGAFDCVEMIAADGVCKKGTVGCNDQICQCEWNGIIDPFD